jgi:putative transposase
MAFNVLMVMAESSLSDLIERALKKRGGYNLIYADNVDDAMEICLQTRFDYAFLDIELAENDLRALSSRLLDTSPEVRLLVVPEEGDYGSSLSMALADDNSALDPVQGEDLLTEVAHILLDIHLTEAASEESDALSAGRSVELGDEKFVDAAAMESHDSNPSWIEDADRAAQQLASSSLSGSVLAAMILREGQLWAYAGQLPQHLAQELAACVNENWRPNLSSDLVRYANLDSGQGLDSDQSEYMLYATCLGNEIILALAFEIETPFSRIRAQVNRLAGALISHPSADRPQLRASKEPITKADEAGSMPVKSQMRKKSVFSLGNVPPPTPSIPHMDIRGKSIDFHFDDQSNLKSNLSETGTNPSPEHVEHRSNPDLPANELIRIRGGSHRPGPKKLFDSDKFPSAEEIPSAGADVICSQDFTYGTPAFYRLYYASLLVPRIPEHHLVGDMSANLPRYMRQIFLAYGWRLKHVDIKPESLQWITCLPPHVPPGKIVTVVRQHTSERIFSDFPRLSSENPSGDFWAPGYLLMSGQSELPERVIKFFIERTRQLQGL